MAHKLEAHFTNEAQAALFVRWLSNQGEQQFADFQEAEGVAEPAMPTYDYNHATYIDFQTVKLRRPNNDSQFDDLEGDELIAAMSGDHMEE